LLAFLQQRLRDGGAQVAVANRADGPRRKHANLQNEIAKNREKMK
jgi:hypothetical protein